LSLFMEDLFRRTFPFSILRTAKDKPADAQLGCGGFRHNICPGYSRLRFTGSPSMVITTDSPDRPYVIARGAGYRGAMPKASFACLRQDGLAWAACRPVT
jgi:hypothetical protein